MNYEAYLIDAIDMVAAWELSEAEFAQAVNDQARLMAGLELNDNHFNDNTIPYPHQ